MKKQLLAMGAIVICCLFMQCNKEEKNVEPNQPDTTTNNNNGDKDNNDQDDPDLTTSCGTVGDNQIMLGDEIFKKDTETANSYLNICMEYDFAQTGTPFLKHERSLYFEDGDFKNAPSINFVLGHVPAAGTTTTYTLDEGYWALLNSEISSQGKARISIDGYYTRNKQPQSWFSNEESGTIEVTADQNGNYRFNFSNVKLVRSGGPLDEKMIICGKNILCEK